MQALKGNVNDEFPEVAETCALALSRIKHFQKHEPQTVNSGFLSVDPAPPLESNDVDYLVNIMLNGSLSLFKRYQAIFSLRNMRSDLAVEMISLGLTHQECSALMRHELCYVLGEMELESAIGPLHDVLKDESQHAMVRHEAAESLGAIGTMECRKILTNFMNDKVEVVRESVVVALNRNEFL